jgi:monoterpene epsilon-lactone hydrolase
MTSTESGTVKDLYVSWTEARLKGEQHDDEAWGDLTAEPRGVDYLEIDAGGVPAMWLVPRGCAEDRSALVYARDVSSATVKDSSAALSLRRRPG